MSHSNQTFDSGVSSCDSSSYASTLKTERVDREDCMKCLLNIFDHTDFEGMQWEIISSILNDKRDTVVTMASVSGKSLCFQFPSVYLNTITIVVKPFRSLMQDQVSKNFPKVKSYFLGSGQTTEEREEERRKIEDIVMNNNILYVTPEYITSPDDGETLLQNKVLHNRLSMIAFDEAHYISCWGDGFRNAYAELWKLKEWCPSVPFLTSTAIPSEEVRDDIIQKLGLRDPQCLSSSVDRPNVKYIVKEKNAATIWEDLKPYISDEKNFPIVIYCVTKYEANNVARAITNIGGLGSDQLRVYHPDVGEEERNQILHDFNNNKIRIVVGTIAFGMDKPDVRLVIFYRVPLRFNDFFILSGLAGRDGLPAQCLLMYDSTDKYKIEDVLRHYGDFNARENANRTWNIFQNYIETPGCRRNFILSFFEEDISQLTRRYDCCDNCEIHLSH